MQTTTLTRVFIWGDQTLPDINPTLSPAAVKAAYTAVYPDLGNAEVSSGKVEKDRMVFTFIKTTGSKGSARPAARGGLDRPSREAARVVPFVDFLMQAAKPEEVSVAQARGLQLKQGVALVSSLVRAMQARGPRLSPPASSLPAMH